MPQPKEKETNSLKIIPQLKDNENKLSKAYEVLVDFDHKKFLEGAKFAFETIINAFNNSDKKTLKNLLTKDVFLTFENAIEEKKNNPNYQFYSIVVDEVTDVLVMDGLINITLKITSEQFKDNDEAIEEIWNKQYALKPFLAPENFKSYDELKAKLDKVLSGVRNTGTAEDVAIPPSTTYSKPDVVAETVDTPTPEVVNDDDGDETLSYFSKLAEEDE